MPLRDHFRPPVNTRRRWEGFHAQWPAMMVQTLTRHLPDRYAAEPRVHLGGSAEIDVATFEEEVPRASGSGERNGGLATEVWAPSYPTHSLRTALPAEAVYEVRVFDQERNSQLVAAVEIVSPANKDRPESRRAFVAKCVALLQNRVSVAVIDLVTTKHFNLYAELLELLDGSDPAMGPSGPYAVASRAARDDDGWRLDSWAYPLTLGEPLPTLPLWLAENLAVPLELEVSYEETCRVLRIA